jgi:hypothetical protein
MPYSPAFQHLKEPFEGGKGYTFHVYANAPSVISYLKELSGPLGHNVYSLKENILVYFMWYLENISRNCTIYKIQNIRVL